MWAVNCPWVSAPVKKAYWPLKLTPRIGNSWLKFARHVISVWDACKACDLNEPRFSLIPLEMQNWKRWHSHLSWKGLSFSILWNELNNTGLFPSRGEARLCEMRVHQTLWDPGLKSTWGSKVQLALCSFFFVFLFGIKFEKVTLKCSIKSIFRIVNAGRLTALGRAPSLKCAF